MLNDTLFAKTTIESGLFYLRLMREFSLNIQLSFYINNEDYIKTAEDFGKRYEDLGKVVTKYGKFSKLAYDNQIFVTNYTLPSERLTEKLFGIDLATELTEKELEFEVGEFKEPSSEVVAELVKLNNDALILTTNFSSFLADISNKINDNTLFSYLYQSLIDYMQEESKLYINILNRIIRREAEDPTFVTNYVTRYQIIMRNAASFLRNLVDPKEVDVFNKFQGFVEAFEAISEDYKSANLSPENQQFLNRKTKVLVEEFKIYLSRIIERVLNSGLHFIISPMFLDTVLIEANYFKYLLESNP